MGAIFFGGRLGAKSFRRVILFSLEMRSLQRRPSLGAPGELGATGAPYVYSGKRPPKRESCGQEMISRAPSGAAPTQNGARKPLAVYESKRPAPKTAPFRATLAQNGAHKAPCFGWNKTPPNWAGARAQKEHSGPPP